MPPMLELQAAFEGGLLHWSDVEQPESTCDACMCECVKHCLGVGRAETQ